MQATVAFWAEDLDDAFAKFEEHFKALREGRDSDLIQAGEISIEEVQDKSYDSTK